MFHVPKVFNEEGTIKPVEITIPLIELECFLNSLIFPVVLDFFIPILVF